MKTYVQWTREAAFDSEILDSADWSSLPKRSIPDGSEVLDGDPGWVSRLCVQGVTFQGHDHYAVESLSGGVCRVTMWNDDPVDFALDGFHAQVWLFEKYAPDARLGGAYNTRQSSTYYAEGLIAEWYARTGVPFLPYSQFVPPAEALTRHGIWASDALNDAHVAAQTPRGWREWNEGLPVEEIVDGELRQQRAMGRYSKAQGSRTYFDRSDVRTSGTHNTCGNKPNNHLALELVTATESTKVSGNIAALTCCFPFIFSTPAGEPDSAAWPEGNYRHQLDVFAAISDARYRFGQTLGCIGHFARQNTSLTSDLEFKQCVESEVQGSGLKMFTSGTVTWSTGSADDRWETLLSSRSIALHGNATITLSLNGSDGFSDGPWAAPAAGVNRVPRPIIVRQAVQRSSVY